MPWLTKVVTVHTVVSSPAQRIHGEPGRLSGSWWPNRAEHIWGGFHRIDDPVPPSVSGSSTFITYTCTA